MCVDFVFITQRCQNGTELRLPSLSLLRQENFPERVEFKELISENEAKISIKCLLLSLISLVKGFEYSMETQDSC